MFLAEALICRLGTEFVYILFALGGFSGKRLHSFTLWKGVLQQNDTKSKNSFRIIGHFDEFCFYFWIEFRRGLFEFYRREKVSSHHR
ncbi:MAG: hypothetical protein OEV50_03265, partial [Candidatus Aminicenantes bacterium]|nr:hypothetical protein [Candidatus Aminicenantes bacterium]